MFQILIPAYKATKYIETTLRSIYGQTYFKAGNLDFEIVVGVDGCPETLEHLKTLKNEYKLPFKIIYFKENKGVYITINSLLKLSTAEEIMIFGADDIMYENLIEVLYKYDADVKQFRYDNLRGNKISKEPSGHHAAGAIYLNRKALNTLGGYKSWRYSADSEMVERIKCSELKHKQINEELFIYRNHSENLTATVDLHKRALQRKQIKFNNYSKEELYVEPEINIGEWL